MQLGKMDIGAINGKVNAVSSTYMFFTIRSKDVNIELSDMEAIEAEVVFLFRLNTGQWPAKQNEIHFQLSNAAHRRMASKIYEAVGG